MRASAHGAYHRPVDRIPKAYAEKRTSFGKSVRLWTDLLASSSLPDFPTWGFADSQALYSPESKKNGSGSVHNRTNSPSATHMRTTVHNRAFLAGECSPALRTRKTRSRVGAARSGWRACARTERQVAMRGNNARQSGGHAQERSRTVRRPHTRPRARSLVSVGRPYTQPPSSGPPYAPSRQSDGRTHDPRIGKASAPANAPHKRRRPLQRPPRPFTRSSSRRLRTTAGTDCLARSCTSPPRCARSGPSCPARGHRDS